MKENKVEYLLVHIMILRVKQRSIHNPHISITPSTNPHSLIAFGNARIPKLKLGEPILKERKKKERKKEVERRGEKRIEEKRREEKRREEKRREDERGEEKRGGK